MPYLSRYGSTYSKSPSGSLKVNHIGAIQWANYFLKFEEVKSSHVYLAPVFEVSHWSLARTQDIVKLQVPRLSQRIA